MITKTTVTEKTDDQGDILYRTIVVEKIDDQGEVISTSTTKETMAKALNAQYLKPFKYEKQEEKESYKDEHEGLGYHEIINKFPEVFKPSNIPIELIKTIRSRGN
ncbi:MAG: hypothetical protein ATN35_09870 [Epulopiscium sp. Nele67-Bin004]|nr:MAG: hypothetical protein ATN35_09870 [Epulopiscium sp. Nele67-Bin004]